MPAKNKNLEILVSFGVLFLLYHGAEYMIVFQNSVIGFFGFQILFFTATYVLGNWYKGNGLTCWGLPFGRKYIKLIPIGILIGILIYALPYCFSLIAGIEEITVFPKWMILIQSVLPFAFGVLFSSFSEDILTRGLIYSHFNTRIGTIWLILLSALIYLLNHIYRLNDGLEALLYIFLLGIVLIIPLIFTKNLWLTGSMHWAGNTFFFATHNVIQTENNNQFISSNYLFAAFLFLFVPVIWLISRKLGKQKA